VAGGLLLGGMVHVSKTGFGRLGVCGSIYRFRYR